ncbi:MAG: hypothetical protein ACHRXM_16875 [Isosphaerales bacterium]
MSRLAHRGAAVAGAFFVLAGTCGIGLRACSAQEELIERSGPPALDNMEVDANKDGVPDGWYNARDAKIMTEGGAVGPHFVRLECTLPGRPARLSRAFGIDGRKTGAIVLGLWIRQSKIQAGERDAAEPGMAIDFLGDELRHLTRGVLGPWTHSVRDEWTRVVKRIAVPPGTKDAITSVGLAGATGVLDIDGLTVELVPVGDAHSTNLVVNGDFELGDPAPSSWITERDVRRVFPGFNSSSAVELSRAKSRLLTGLAIDVGPFEGLDVSVAARISGLRGAGGAIAKLFFLNDMGTPLADHLAGEHLFSWSDSSPWRVYECHVDVPRGAVRAVIQFEKMDSIGSIRLDDVRATALPNPDAGSWAPFQVADETDEWLPVPPSPSIIAGSALDVSFLVPAPAGLRGFVSVSHSHLAFSHEDRARFFGVCLIPPTAFLLEPERADQLADRLVRSGINLVRLGELDTPFGPDRSLFDDSRDDTKEFDPVALARLDHLVAALKKRGIYVALELQSKRRFRIEDGVTLPGSLPAGGGPASLFDPLIGKLELASARALLGRVNPETELALRDDPALAWVTLSGETSLFNLIDNPNALPAPYAEALHALAAKSSGGSGRRFWESLELDHSEQMAKALRKDHVRVPIAGVSHWRREPEFCAAQAGPVLDLIDDRIFWAPHTWVAPERHSLLWSPPEESLAAIAAHKRRPDRPYVLGQWCDQTLGAWSFPHEAADQLLGVYTAMAGDWDAVVRRGIFFYPQTWGEGPAGTIGGEDIFQIAEVSNGSPHIYALWPHVASLFFRGRQTGPDHNAAAKGRRRSVSGWDPVRGRLVVDTPYTQGVAGWIGGSTASCANLDFSTNNPFAVLVATSLSDEPIATTKRLLVSAIARVEPTGFRWVDAWKREVADPGRPPFLQEPVTARVVWRRKGSVQAHVLDNEGQRIRPVTVDTLKGGQGVSLVIDGKTAAFHWELTVE